jgi:hypothetical protein
MPPTENQELETENWILNVVHPWPARKLAWGSTLRHAQTVLPTLAHEVARAFHSNQALGRIPLEGQYVSYHQQDDPAQQEHPT